MSIGYINTLEYLKDRVKVLSLETQEKYFLEKLDLVIKYVKEKLEIYNNSKVLIDTYVTLVGEFKSVLEKVSEQGNKELLFNIYLDIEEEIEKLGTKYVS
jgi:hypothetical protein